MVSEGGADAEEDLDVFCAALGAGCVLESLRPHQRRAVTAVLSAVVAESCRTWVFQGADAGSSAVPAGWASGSGYLVAHSMGLGKTVTAIRAVALVATLAHALRRAQRHQAAASGLHRSPGQSAVCAVGFVAVPKTAAAQWADECRRWWPRGSGLPRLVVVDCVAVRDSQPSDGPSTAAAWMCDTVRRTLEAAAARSDGPFAVLLLGTTDIAERLVSSGVLDPSATAAGWQADVLVVDECQRIQRQDTYAAGVMASVKARAVVGLSGYPLQNNARELYALLRLIDLRPSSTPTTSNATVPPPLPTPDVFERAVVQPLSWLATASANLSAMSDVDRNGRLREAPEWAASEAARSTLHLLCQGRIDRVGPSVLRAQLPPLTAVTVTCAASPLQQALFAALSSSGSANRSAPVAAGIFATAAWMSLAAAHPRCLEGRVFTTAAKGQPALAADDGEGEAIAEVPPDVAAEMAACFARHGAAIAGAAGATSQTVSLSPKLQLCVSVVEAAVRSGRRVLVFSHLRDPLPVLVASLTLPAGFTAVCVDGSTPASTRQLAVARFNDLEATDGPRVLGLTTKACGVALNLTAASVVVILSPSWNPCHDEQAFHRAYRIGQQSPVTVLRLVTEGSLEPHIRQQQRGKEVMAASVMSALRDGLREKTKTKPLLPPSPTSGDDGAIIAAVSAASSAAVANAIHSGRANGWATAIANDTFTVLESEDAVGDAGPAHPLRPSTAARSARHRGSEAPRCGAPTAPATTARRAGRTGRGNLRDDGDGDGGDDGQAGLLHGASAPTVSAATVSSALVQLADMKTNVTRQDERAAVGDAAADLFDAAWSEAGL